MQWTTELDALLNQCVFECGYDFTVASQLLLSRAKQLRLLRADEKIALTSDECQVQWMAINPVIEEGDEGERSNGLDDDDLYLRRSLASPEDEETDGVDNSAAIEDEGHNLFERSEETRLVEPTAKEECSQSNSSQLEIPDGCPKLELSLTDADLDTLLASLPGSQDVHDQNDFLDADAKDTRSGSEMQWVLSFLTSPQDIACRDAEAKNMLFDDSDRSEDDNYQYFLQELNKANLLSPRKPDMKENGKHHACKPKRLEVVNEDDASDEDDSSDDWTEARKLIKASTSSAKIPAMTHKRRLTTTGSHKVESLPPAAPLRFPPRTEIITSGAGIPSVEDGEDDNGLDALPSYASQTPSALTCPGVHQAPNPNLPPSSTKLIALTHEIGHQLRQSGEFKFPERLFRIPDNGYALELEQVPEDEP